MLMSKKNYELFLMMLLPVILPVFSAFANNIAVSNAALKYQDVSAKQVFVEFDLSWDNSWRNALNHDAAWVFVKFRAPGSNKWEHAFVSVDSGQHVSAPGSQIQVGTTEIEGVPRGAGVFISNSDSYTGSVSYVRTGLLWDYGASGYEFAQGEVVDISVHAIEMVYVPEGSFYVGSGDTVRSSFTDGGWESGNTTPFPIESEDALTIQNETGYLWATGTITPGELPAEFPKGFAAFYCMKYEITQGQYAEFLDLLAETQANTRFPDNYGNYRHTVRVDAGVYSADTPDRACNFLSWVDGAAYADWAGLRPMTELEYEKACRGPATPVPNERAWGSANLVPQRNHYISGPADGSGGELSTSDTAGNTLGANFNNSRTTGGPVRVGIYAATAVAIGGEITRENTGASYWGIMELSGNLYERTVSVLKPAFEGSHGDGALSDAGAATPADWQALGFRGGVWSDTSDMTHVSNRWYTNDTRTTRYYYTGFRAVRSAP